MRNPVEWWDVKCDKAIKDRIAARKTYERSKDLASKIEYKKTIAIARRITKQKKRENFKSFATNLNRFSNIKYIWQKMNIFKNRDNKRDRDKEGDAEFKEVVRREMSKVAPDWAEEKPFDWREETREMGGGWNGI